MLTPTHAVAVPPLTPRRQPAVLAVLASLNLAGGLLMHWYVLGRLGAGTETDALFASLALPQALLTIVASSFMTVLVPLLSGEDETDFRRNAWTFAAATLAMFVGAGVLLAILAPWWVPVLVPGLQGPARELAVQLARIQLLGMVWTSMAGILGAVSRARHEFVWVECAPLLSTVVSGTVLVLVLPAYGVHAAAWVQVLRISLHAVLLVPGLGRFAGFTRDRSLLREALRRLRPLMLGTAYFRTEPLFDRGLSSLAPPGDLSMYYLCQQVCSAGLQLTNNALIAPLVPALAQHAKAGHWTAFDAARRRTSRAVLMLSLAGSALVIAGAAWVITAGVLPPSAAAPVARATWLIAGLGGVLIAGPLAESLRSAFYATGNTRMPVRIDALVFTLGLVLKVTGFAAFGVLGLALAASSQAVLSALALKRGLTLAIAERAEVA